MSDKPIYLIGVDEGKCPDFTTFLTIDSITKMIERMGAIQEQPNKPRTIAGQLHLYTSAEKVFLLRSFRSALHQPEFYSPGLVDLLNESKNHVEAKISKNLN